MAQLPDHEPEPRISAWQIGILPILVLTTLIAVYLAAAKAWGGVAVPLWLQVTMGGSAMVWLVFAVFRTAFLVRRYRHRRQRDMRHRAKLESWLDQRDSDSST